jgi:hypothetical protein
MKRLNKLNLLIAVLLFCGIQSASSQTLKDFFASSETPVVYLGVDFTKARLIGESGNPMDIRDRLYNSINDLTVNEPKKYDIAGAFHKSNVTNDLSAVKARNVKVNAEEIISSNSEDYNRLKESDIASIVKALNISGKKGIGVLFVMEAMRKVDKRGTAAVWTVLVDLQSKKVLHAERVESKATGIGFRNYWASTIKETLETIEKKKYKEWKAKYGS